MVTVIGVRFKQAGKVYYFDPGEQVLNIGDHVIVETARGTEFGEVSMNSFNHYSYGSIGDWLYRH